MGRGRGDLETSDNRPAGPGDPDLNTIDSAGVKFGPFWLAPGISAWNAVSLMYSGFSLICLISFVTFTQPFLFNALGIPTDRQGTLAGLLVALQEGVQVAIAGLIGALSDRSGRRWVFVAGLVGMSFGLFIYPLAGSETGLLVYRAIYAVGMTAATVMMSTCFAEYTQERTRGRWMGTIAMLNGVGVVLMAVVLAKLPQVFMGLGYGELGAIRASFWTFAVYVLLLATMLRFGLQARPASAVARKTPLLRQTAQGFVAARDNARIGLAYLTAFASRGDLVIITTFVSLWVFQAGLDAGLSPGAATARAGMIFGLAQGMALIWSFCMGLILDRVNRVTGICIAFGLATTGYLALGQVEDPFGRWMIPAAVLAGIGEGGAMVSSGVLVGQEAPARIRGVVLGTFGLAGAVGIICLTWLGGLVFDTFGRTAPFTMMGFINAGVFGVALLVRFARPVTAASRRIPASAGETGGT